MNPIQDSANRSILDKILREVSASGIFVSAEPHTVMKLGTKETLYTTRHLGWGSDSEIYRSSVELVERFPARLKELGRVVVKQARGNGGDGVWRVDLLERDVSVEPTNKVRVQHALNRDGSSELMSLGSFIERCDEYFEWSGCLIDQAFQARLSDGMVRCYFSLDEVVGFCRQAPKGLLEENPEKVVALPATRSLMEGPDVTSYQNLRESCEQEWIPQMMRVLDIERDSLPIVWDADFLFGAKTASGGDTYALSEVNVSAVWPFPPHRVDVIAANALALTLTQLGRRA